MAIDPYSPTWVAVSAWVEDCLAVAFAELAAHGRDIAETEFRRGQIDCLRSLLALPGREATAPPPQQDGPVIA